MSQLFQSCGAVANEVVTTVCVPVVHLDPDDDDRDNAVDADAEVANEDVATVQPPQVMEMLMVLAIKVDSVDLQLQLLGAKTRQQQK